MKKIKNILKEYSPTILFLALCLIPILYLLKQNSKEPMIGVLTSAVGHYGENIGVPQYAVNDRWLGNCSGWGGGGGFAGGVALPRHPKKPFFIQVKWESCDVSHITYVNGKKIDESQECITEWHEATIPINFSVKPGESGGMFIHFLPGHRVEAWVSRYGPESDFYPGPAYPRGSAPSNPPMPQKNALANPQVLKGTKP